MSLLIPQSIKNAVLNDDMTNMIKSKQNGKPTNIEHRSGSCCISNAGATIYCSAFSFVGLPFGVLAYLSNPAPFWNLSQPSRTQLMTALYGPTLLTHTCQRNGFCMREAQRTLGFDCLLFHSTRVWYNCLTLTHQCGRRLQTHRLGHHRLSIL